MYAVHLRLTGKLVVDILLVIIELFFATCFRFVTMHAFDGRTDRMRQQYRALHTCMHSHGKNSAFCISIPLLDLVLSDLVLLDIQQPLHGTLQCLTFATVTFSTLLHADSRNTFFS